VGEIRHVFSKHGGNLGATGCVSYLFEKKGIIRIDGEQSDADTVMEAALDAGAEDVIESEDSLEVVTSHQDFETIKSALSGGALSVLDAEISMEATTSVTLAGSDAETMLHLSDALEDLDDVQNVYSNYNISEEEMSRFA